MSMDLHFSFKFHITVKSDTYYVIHQVLGYTFLHDPIMTEDQRKLYEKDESIRKIFLVKDDFEVRELVFNTLLDTRFDEEIRGKHLPQIKSDANFYM